MEARVSFDHSDHLYRHPTCCVAEEGLPLAGTLQRHPYLESLDLSGAGLGDEGATKLCPYLAELFQLKELNLSGNGLPIKVFFR